jgi:hypothetical protein
MATADDRHGSESYLREIAVPDYKDRTPLSLLHADPRIGKA